MLSMMIFMPPTGVNGFQTAMVNLQHAIKFLRVRRLMCCHNHGEGIVLMEKKVFYDLSAFCIERRIGFIQEQNLCALHGGYYDPKHFDKFEYVLTGHYHIKSSRDNIHYLGSQYQMAFSDVWEAKGFHVFDFAARTLEFIENPKRLFYTFDYDETKPEKLDYSKFKDTYVKIFIKNRTKGPTFEKYLDKFYEAGVAELAVTEDVTANPDLVAVDIHKDTLQLLHEEIDTVTEKSINKNVLADIINSAYNAAMSKDED